MDWEQFLQQQEQSDLVLARAYKGDEEWVLRFLHGLRFTLLIEYDDVFYEHFDRLKAAVESRFPRAEVYGNAPLDPSLFSPVTERGLGRLTQEPATRYMHRSTGKVVLFPRDGAFEIAISRPADTPGDRQDNCVVHSRLASQKKGSAAEKRTPLQAPSHDASQNSGGSKLPVASVVLRKVGRALTNAEALCDNSRRSLIYLAACGGHCSTIAALYEFGASVQLTTTQSATPLQVAALRGHTEAVKQLFALGVDPAQGNAQGRSPLHVAAFHGHAAVVRILLGPMGVPVDAVDKSGRSALHMLCQSGNFLPLAEVLIDHGADVSLVSNADGRTALHSASISGQVEAVTLLLAHHAEVNRCDDRGESALCAAAAAGKMASVIELVKHGGDVLLCGNNGQSPLFNACAAGHLELALRLHGLGADLLKANFAGVSPTTVALVNGHQKVADAITHLLSMLSVSSERLAASGHASKEDMMRRIAHDMGQLRAPMNSLDAKPKH